MSTDLSQLKRKGERNQTELIAGRVDKETKAKLDWILSPENENISISTLVYKLVKDFVAGYKPKNEKT